VSLHFFTFARSSENKSEESSPKGFALCAAA
jgi:hypothetical protein